MFKIKPGSTDGEKHYSVPRQMTKGQHVAFLHLYFHQTHSHTCFDSSLDNECFHRRFHCDFYNCAFLIFILTLIDWF